MRPASLALTAGWLSVVVVAAGPTPAPQAPPDPTVVGRTTEGFTLRLALKTGHVSNYDESKVAGLHAARSARDVRRPPVRTAADWKARRAEILTTYEDDIYGRVPANVPKVRWEVAATDPNARDGAVLRRVVGAIGDGR